jgi:hypothetical protein
MNALLDAGDSKNLELLLRQLFKQNFNLIILFGVADALIHCDDQLVGLLQS